MRIWLIEIILALYVILRIVLPLKCRWYWKLPAALYVCYAAGSLHLGFRLARAGFAGVSTAALFSAFSYAVIFTFFLLLLGVDLLRLCLIPAAWHFKQMPLMPFRRHAGRIHLALLGVSILLAAAGMIEGTSMPRLKHYSIPLAALPEAADGTRVVLLADLHAGHLAGAQKIRKIVETVNTLQPDIVLIAGDFVDGSVSERKADLEPLKELHARRGVYGISGNHEYYSGYPEWKKVFGEFGVKMLDNSHVTIPGICTVAGVTYRMADTKLALAGRDGSLPVILMRHDPRYAESAAQHGIGLQVSGHTHGGMILGLDRLVAAMNGGFVRGLYKVGKMSLIVSAGTNIWGGFPVRIGVPPEISVITLHPDR